MLDARAGCEIPPFLALEDDFGGKVKHKLVVFTLGVFLGEVVYVYVDDAAGLAMVSLTVLPKL